MFARNSLIGLMAVGLFLVASLTMDAGAAPSMVKEAVEKVLAKIADQRKEILNRLISKVDSLPGDDKEKFTAAKNDSDFMRDIRKLDSVLREKGEIEAIRDKQDVSKARQAAYEQGYEEIFDQLQDDGSNWIIPKLLEQSNRFDDIYD